MNPGLGKKQTVLSLNGFSNKATPKDLFQNQWLIQELKSMVGIGNEIRFSPR